MTSLPDRLGAARTVLIDAVDKTTAARHDVTAASVFETTAVHAFDASGSDDDLETATRARVRRERCDRLYASAEAEERTAREAMTALEREAKRSLMRAGEQHGLSFAGVHDDGPIPFFRLRQAALLPADGKSVEIGALKTKSARRDVPIHPLVASWLAWWKAAGWRAHVGRDPKPEDLIFANSDGEVWRPEGSKVLKSLLDSRDLPTQFIGPDGTKENLTWHALRRTFATALSAAEVDGDVADALLGHAPKSVRGRHYAAPSLERSAKAVAKAPIRNNLIKTARKNEGETCSSTRREKGRG